jgi:hypothetical protein
MDFVSRGRLRWIAISGDGIKRFKLYCLLIDIADRKINLVFCQQTKPYFLRPKQLRIDP